MGSAGLRLVLERQGSDNKERFTGICCYVFNQIIRKTNKAKTKAKGRCEKLDLLDGFRALPSNFVQSLTTSLVGLALMCSYISPGSGFDVAFLGLKFKSD